MTVSGRITAITAATTRNGKPYFKIGVNQRADGKDVILYLWNAAMISKFNLNQSYDFDVDYSDKEMKYRAINDAVAVTYSDEDMGYPSSLDAPAEKPIEAPSAAAQTRVAPQTSSQGSWTKTSKQDNDIHIIRESALKSAAVFLARPTADEKYNEDDLIYIASKLEDYIKNGAVL